VDLTQVLAEHIGEYMLYDEPFNRAIACPKPAPAPWLLRVYRLLYATSAPRKSWWPAWLTLRLPAWADVNTMRKVPHPTRIRISPQVPRPHVGGPTTWTPTGTPAPAASNNGTRSQIQLFCTRVVLRRCRQRTALAGSTRARRQ
jgi:hypothetical protein